MKGFFSQRLQRHQKQMSRYLRYVFNDHFCDPQHISNGWIGSILFEFVKNAPRPFPQGDRIAIDLVGTFVSRQVGNIGETSRFDFSFS